VTGGQTSLTVSEGVAHVKFYGVPGYTYQVQRSINLADWVGLQTTTVDSSGIIEFADTFSDLGSAPTAAFYRLKWQP
jgi:hypothetical protein